VNPLDIAILVITTILCLSGLIVAYNTLFGYNGSKQTESTTNTNFGEDK
jgi:hypothetical protein